MRDFVFYADTKNAPCNLCGVNPKCERQGICNDCRSKRSKLKWVASRPPKRKIPNLPGEKWKDLVEAIGYQISSYGRVKSLNYFEEPGRHHILKLREARRGGYLKVDLDKYNWRPSVHRLVALYFIPNPQKLPMVLHKDNNKQNNRKDNLYWGDCSMNRRDYINHTNATGVKRQEMKAKTALLIFKSKKSHQQIAIYYNISPSTVWMIKTGYRWSSVTGAKNTDKRSI